MALTLRSSRRATACGLRTRLISNVRRHMENPTALWRVCVALLPLAACSASLEERSGVEALRLCAQDGGVRVYEKATWPADKPFRIPTKEQLTAQDAYFIERKESMLQGMAHSPPGIHEYSLKRTHVTLIRVADGKLLGENVSYYWTASDTTGPWSASAFSCPKTGENAFMAVFGVDAAGRPNKP